MRFPKYSIIIPTRNGAQYLASCINTIISQNYDNYELVISDDHSEDETKEILSKINRKNVIVLEPPHNLSMSEHWEWALSHATGEWCMFVGQDDGLQPYFFNLADSLVAIADKKKILTIMSKRAYYFWPGCESVYGNVMIDYHAQKYYNVLNWKYMAALALTGFVSYFDLPQMYTTSLFKKELIADVKKKQGGVLFTTHPQDANLAAIACSVESRYLMSYIPLGWVGSSPKSAGMAITEKYSKVSKTSNDLSDLRNDYLKKTILSPIQYHPLVGDFSIGSCVLYFWGAIKKTKSLRSPLANQVFNVRIVLYFVLAASFSEIRGNVSLDIKPRIELLLYVISKNKCNIALVKVVSTFLNVLHFLYEKGTRLKLKVNNMLYKSYAVYLKRTNDENGSLLLLSEKINKELDRRNIIDVDKNVD